MARRIVDIEGEYTKRARSRYSFGEAETALCLFDAYCDQENRAWGIDYSKEPHAPCEPKPNRPVPGYLKQRGEIGSFAVRQIFITLARPVEQLWKSLGADLQDGYTFDWEFCHDVLCHGVDWGTLNSDGFVKLFPNAKALVLAHRALFKKFAA